MLRFRLPAAFMLLFLLAGCGYGFSHGQSVLPEDKRTMAIVEVKNPAPLSWLEPRLRSLLRDEVTRRGIGQWSSHDKAKSLVTIDVKEYFRRSSVTGTQEETLQDEARITFECIIRSSVDGTVIWRSGSLTQVWKYTPGNEDEADKTVTELAIRRLADRMSNDF